MCVCVYLIYHLGEVHLELVLIAGNGIRNPSSNCG